MKQFIFITIILIGAACGNTGNSGLKYKHAEELKSYFNEVHRFTFPDKNTSYLLVIPVGGCSNCIAAAFEMARKYAQHKDFFVLITANTKKDFVPYRNHMQQLSANVLIDSTGRDNNYELGILGPSFFRLENGKVQQVTELNLENIKSVFYESFGY